MDSENWRALLEDDKNFDQNVDYKLSSILENIDKLTDLNHFNPYNILSPIYEFTKIFGKISSALGMGFKDITEKVNLMRQIIKQYPSVNNIQDLILEEIKLNIHQLNGKNNSDFGHKKDQYKNYVSGSRTFLRLLWFLEFMIAISRKVVKDDNKTLKEILKDAYGEVLGPRHPFLVRAAVNTALTFASCTKEQAVEYIYEEKQLNEDSKKKITAVADKLEIIWKAGNDFYSKNNLLKLS